VGCGVGEADVGVGGGLRGAAAVEWRRRQRVEKHGGRWAVEWERRTWLSVAGWEVQLGLGLGYILCSQLADYSTGPKADRNAQREATSWGVTKAAHK